VLRRSAHRTVIIDYRGDAAHRPRFFASAGVRAARIDVTASRSSKRRLRRHHPVLGGGVFDLVDYKMTRPLLAEASVADYLDKRHWIPACSLSSGLGCSQEKTTGWRYQLIVTDIEDLGRSVPGSHHVFFLDTLHCQHAVVEDRVPHREGHGPAQATVPRIRAEQGLAAGREHGLRPAHLPPAPRPLRAAGADRAEPASLRTMILHIPARLVTHARQRVLKIEQTWPWALAVVEARDRLGAIPAPA